MHTDGGIPSLGGCRDSDDSTKHKALTYRLNQSLSFLDIVRDCPGGGVSKSRKSTCCTNPGRHPMFWPSNWLLVSGPGLTGPDVTLRASCKYSEQAAYTQLIESCASAQCVAQTTPEHTTLL